MKLCPVLEDCPITSVGHQLLRILGHLGIQVVPYIVHETLSLLSFSRVNLIRVCLYFVGWFEPVHVNVSIRLSNEVKYLELIVELLSKLLMKLFRKIP